MSDIEWKPRQISIEQKGFLYWGWEVKGDGYGSKTGSCMTKRAAVRRAKRYRRGVLHGS